MANFQKLNFFHQNVLPTVYDDALSYEEAILKMMNQINALTEYINQFDYDEIKGELEAFKAYIDTQIQGVQGEFDKLVAANAKFEKETNATVATFQGQINLLSNRLESDIAACNKRTDDKIKQNNEVLLDEIAHNIINIKVINYFTGERVPIQDMLDYLCQFHLQNAINYAQLETRQKTVDQFIAYNMSYKDLAMNGASLIV